MGLSVFHFSFGLGKAVVVKRLLFLYTYNSFSLDTNEANIRSHG